MLEDVIKSRRQRFLKQVFKYLRLLLNDHFTILIFFLIGSGAYFYKELLSQIDSNIGNESYFLIVFMSLLIVGIMFMGKTPSYLEEADILFLMPKLNRFKSLFYRFATERLVIKLVFIFLLTLLFSPLLTLISTYKSGQVGLLFLQFVLNTVVVMLIDTESHLYFENRQRFQNTLIIAVLSFFGVFLSLRGNLWAGVSVTFVLFILEYAYLLLYLKKSERQLVVMHLISEETARKQHIYRFFSLVTDIPKLKEEPLKFVKSWSMIKRFFPHHSDPISYLLPRFFFRKKSYFFLYLRLIVLGGVLIRFSTQGVLIVLFSILFQLLILIHVLPIIFDIENRLQFKLSSVKKIDLLNRFKTFLYRLSSIVILIFTMITTFKSLKMALTVFAINVLVLLLFSHVYLPRKIA